MKKLLKIGDKVYAQSIQHFFPSYIQGFPQREQFLLQHLVGKCEIEFFRHAVINELSDVCSEQKKLKKHLDKHSYDYILIDNPLSMLLVDNEVNIPIIFDCIDWYEEMYLKEFGENRRYFLLKYGLDSIIEKATKVTAQSPVILDSLKKRGLKTDKTCVIPNGYDEKIFYPYSVHKIALLKENFSKQYNVDLINKKIIVYTGKLSSWYEDIKLIISSLSKDQILFIVGDGPLLADIPNNSLIIKTGAVPLLDVPKYTNIADVLVFPVSVDCSPIAVSEYLAVGKPIVMGKGRIEWLLKDGVNGCLVDRNTDSWKKGLTRAFKERGAMGKNNLRLSSHLSWEEASSSFASFLEVK